MASTYVACAQQVPLSTNKNCIDIFNTAASGKIIKVYRVWMENSQTTAVTGVISITELNRTTAASAGLPIVPVTFDSTNVALGTITAGSARTCTVGNLLRRWIWHTDEPAVIGGTFDELETLSHATVIWDSGFNDSTIQPITLREGFGLAVRNVTSTVGAADFFIEFTVE